VNELDLRDDPELRAIFAEEMSRHVADLLRPTADHAAWRRTLHAMLGASRMMGIEVVAGPTEALQEALRKDARPAAQEALGRLAAALTAVGVPAQGLAAVTVPAGAAQAARVTTLTGPAPSLGGLDAEAAEEVRRFFRDDTRERLATVAALLVRLALGAEDHRGILDAMLRELHALKGAAATVGFVHLARGVHALEGAAQALRARSGPPGIHTVAAMEAARVRLSLALDEDDQGERAAEEALQRLRDAGLLRQRDVLQARPSSMAPAFGGEGGPEVIRVPALAVARLSESVGEVGYVQRRIDRRSGSVHEVARSLQRAARTVEDVLRRIGPARPWGVPAEALAQLQGVERAVRGTVRALDGEAAAIRQDSEHLAALGAAAAESLQGLGRVGAGWLFDRVAAAVDAAALASARQVRVQRYGEGVELDRAVAERLVEPLTQLARNAVAHGIERPAQRLAASKPAWATLRLEATRQGDALRFMVEDDGAGIDLAAVRAQAEASGLEAGPALTEAGLLELLFLPGFSTRRQADAEAGRGVGLDLVREELRRLGGTVRARTRPGAGARFEVELVPRALSQRVLYVRGGGERVMLPLGAVDAVVARQGDDSALAVVALSSLYGSERAGGALVVVLRCARGRFGLAVDAVESPVEVLVRPLPPSLVGRSVFAGASIDGDGSVVLLLDPERAVEYGPPAP